LCLTYRKTEKIPLFNGVIQERGERRQEEDRGRSQETETGDRAGTE